MVVTRPERSVSSNGQKIVKKIKRPTEPSKEPPKPPSQVCLVEPSAPPMPIELEQQQQQQRIPKVTTSDFKIPKQSTSKHFNLTNEDILNKAQKSRDKQNQQRRV